MNKKFCDRCGAEILEKGNFFKAKHAHFVMLEKVGIPEENAIDYLANAVKSLTASLTGENSREETQDYELCEKCAKDFNKWINKDD